MSTRNQRIAYRELCAKRLESHQIQAYGMVPIAARHPGHCKCGQMAPGPYGRGEQECPFWPGCKIVKFRGAWWNVSCVERVKLAEFKASARFVLVEDFERRPGFWEKGWTDDAQEANIWRRNVTDGERVIDRHETQTAN